MEKAIAYRRVSDPKQIEDGISYDEVQPSWIYKIAERDNLDLILPFFEDPGISGEIVDRPGLKKLIAYAKQHDIRHIIAFRMDRIGRFDSLQDRADVWGKWIEDGKVIHTSEGITDLGDESNRLISEVRWIFDAQENRVKRQRVKAANAKLREMGEYRSCRIFGYSKVKVGKTIHYVIVESEAEVIRLVKQLYLDGMGGMQIANYLNERGFLFYGKPYDAGNLLWLVRNTVYAGYTIFGYGSLRCKESLDMLQTGNRFMLTNVPPIVSYEFQEAVNKEIILRSRSAGRPLTPHLIFSGLLQCICGGKCACTGSQYDEQIRAGNHSKARYVCRNTRGKTCKAKSFLAGPIQQEIESDLNVVLQYVYRKSIEESAVQISAEDKAKLSEVDRKIAKLSRDFYLEAKIPEDLFNSLKGELDKMRATITDRLKRAVSVPLSPYKPIDWLDVADAKKRVEEVIDCIVIENQHVARVHWRNGYGAALDA